MRLSFFRNLAHFASALPLVPVATLCAALAGCSGDTKGQVILALQTDMSLPDDVTKVRIIVTENGASRYDRSFVVDPTDPDAEKIPATLSVVAGEKDNQAVELTVIALRPLAGGNGELEPRTLNKTVTTIPKERIAMLRIPMQWLCTGTVSEIDTDKYESNCQPKSGKETACVAGACKDVHLDSSKLPDFSEQEIFGGSETASQGTCFPTEDCFDAGTDLTPDLSDCTVAFNPPSNTDVLNFAILAQTDPSLPGHGGICTSQNCYVGLDKNQEFGWYELASDTAGDTGERRFQLPQGVCDRLMDGRAIGFRVSTDDACVVTKTPKYPTCGPWSGVGKQPEKPPGNDGDNDGFDSEASGGDDCDDADPTVYPNAPEACDLKDNNCDNQIDNSCVMDLPFSHHVDFSALTSGFTSSQDYAIYQNFDATNPIDLDHKTLTFTPNTDHTRYTVVAGALDWDASALGALVPVTTGEDVSSCDDCYTSLDLEFPFNFFGTEYQTVFPASNGYLTFVQGDETYSESVEYFLAGFPRIAAMFDDLDTRGSSDTTVTIDDEVHFFSSTTKLVITYQNIQHFSQSGTLNTFQFVLFDDGTIKISYDGLDAALESSLAGITPGSLGGGVTCTAPYIACYGSCIDPQTDPTNCGACGTVCASEACSQGACLGEAVCQVSNAPCDGVCLGSCTLSTAAPCDGICYGTCSGTCDPDDGSGSCNGTCTGQCQGQCTLIEGGSCPLTCSGSCYLDTGMTCANPAEGTKGPCSFSGTSIASEFDCYDFANTADGSYALTCSGTECECCRSGGSASVCEKVEAIPTDACVSETILRATFLDQCMQGSPCGAGCPSSQPTSGEVCDETEISYCYYNQGAVYCYCMGGEYICN